MNYQVIENWLPKRLPVLSFYGVALICVALSFYGCTGRSITKPRSEIIEEARDNGVHLPGVEEEKRRFYAEQSRAHKRLSNLVAQRSAYGSTDPNYRLGAGDTLEISVYDVEELNQVVQVRQSGYITLPLIGKMKALGYTEPELESRISHKLQQFVRSPEVNIAISNYESKKVSVLGAVNQPGAYPLKKGQNSIVELISMAGGLSERAGSYMNFIPAEYARQGQGKMMGQYSSRRLHSSPTGGSDSRAIELPLTDVLAMNGDIPLSIPVRAGDMIIIPDAGQVMVEGEVEKRGAYDIATRTTLLGALAAAGGITYSAKVDEVEVIRNKGQGRTRLVVNLEEILSGIESDVPLRNGDIIRVPSHSGRRLRQDTFDSITRIINFGVGGSVNMAQ